MLSCGEMKKIRNKKYNQKYEELLQYIENKIFSNLLNESIFINENETLSKHIKFADPNWISLLENAGYTVDNQKNCLIPTVKISGW